MGTWKVVVLIVAGFVEAASSASSATAQPHAMSASFDVIYFDNDSTVVGALDANVVRTMRAWLAQHPDGRIIVEGHADRHGSAAYNQALSRVRAEAVRQALVAAGVPREKLAIVASGEYDPISSDEARNRRVEIWATTL